MRYRVLTKFLMSNDLLCTAFSNADTEDSAMMQSQHYIQLFVYISCC